MEDNLDTCLKHFNRYLRCIIDGCTSIKVCKLCSVNDKEKVKHLYDHFESIVSQQDELSKYKDQLKIVEEFGELNKLFINQLEKAECFADNAFQCLVN